MILMPIFMNGIENSIARSLAEEIVNGAIAMSASFLTSSPTIPSQFPFASFLNLFSHFKQNSATIRRLCVTS